MRCTTDPRGQFRQITEAEPLEGVVFLRGSVDRRTAPVRDEEGVGFQVRVGEIDLKRSHLHQVDGDLFAALTSQRLLR